MKKSTKILGAMFISAPFIVAGYVLIDGLIKECKYLQTEVRKIRSVQENTFFLYDDKNIVRRGNLEDAIEKKEHNFLSTPETIQTLITWKSPFDGERFLEEDLSKYMQNPKRDSFGAYRREHVGVYDHQGIDLFADEGTVLYPAGIYGEVIKVYNDPHQKLIVETKKSSFLVEHGKTLEILYPAGIISRYSHLRDILVEEGQPVYWNSPVATVGTTGNAASSGKGPHLHFELHSFSGEILDPLKVINTSNNELADVFAEGLRVYFEQPRVFNLEN